MDDHLYFRGIKANTFFCSHIFERDIFTLTTLKMNKFSNHYDIFFNDTLFTSFFSILDQLFSSLENITLSFYYNYAQLLSETKLGALGFLFAKHKFLSDWLKKKVFFKSNSLQNQHKNHKFIIKTLENFKKLWYIDYSIIIMIISFSSNDKYLMILINDYCRSFKMAQR